MSEYSHYDILDRVIERLQAMDLSPVSPNMIYAAEFPFSRQLTPGIACSEISESEGAGTNERDDFRYGVMLTRIFGGGGHGDYRKDLSRWRQRVRSELHRKPIGNIDHEIVTKVSPGRIRLSKQWRDWGVDASVMEVWTWVREPRA